MSVIRKISELKGIHKGNDIYVIGAGSSMDFIDPAFFLNKITIGVNFVYKKFPCDYVVGKELPQEAFDVKTHKLIVSKHPHGNVGWKHKEYDGEGSYWVFEHNMNQHTIINWDFPNDDYLVVSYSSLSSAMHLAAHLGAENIILCGIDGGTINGNFNFEGYYQANNEEGDRKEWYRGFIIDMLPQITEVKEFIKKTYNCNIYSLNPWLTFDLGGNEYKKADQKKK